MSGTNGGRPKKCTDVSHIRIYSKTDSKSYCKECRHEKYILTKDDPVFKHQRAISRQKHRYGVSVLPSGLCRICETAPATTQDHNHITGKARGFLCNKCNVRLSGLEMPEWECKAKKYLMEYE